MAYVLACVMLLCIPTQAYAEMQLTSEAAVSLEATTAEIIFDKQAHEKHFPASMTKVMTGLLLMEHAKANERIVFSENALKQEKSNYMIEFQAGESVDRDTALYILMVLSANDMAYAIGEHIAGSEEAFAKMMTERAKELGANDTNFVTASGLHHPEHYSTAYDIALITREALKHDVLVKAMGTKSLDVTTSHQKKFIRNKGRAFENPHFFAAKTGFTDQAGNTLVEVDQVDGKRVINVVMQSKNPAYYEDMRNISSYAFSQLEKKVVLDKQSWRENVVFLDKQVKGTVEQSVELFVPKDKQPNITTEIKLVEKKNEDLYINGIKKGDVIGQLDVKNNGQIIQTVPVIATEAMIFEKTVGKVLSPGTSMIERISWAAGTAFVSVVLLIAIRRVFIVRKRMKRRPMKRRPIKRRPNSY
ncbi:D-alanyl-D-alanine carboxypeptidase [Priestia taiwanensis]|uniref:serine-type D-Ala-D-Ala carboxypeptidase n=2 Tax=Priestia taiwanensis TaxID=1347902 RepID=A0A917AT43_9BACI|nr:D-alanyl-D-alanine carboxypeptidase [Priestia taiwanensis]